MTAINKNFPNYAKPANVARVLVASAGQNRQQRRAEVAKERHKPAQDRKWAAMDTADQQKRDKRDRIARRIAEQKRRKDLKEKTAKAPELGVGQPHLERRESRYTKKDKAQN